MSTLLPRKLVLVLLLLAQFGIRGSGTSTTKCVVSKWREWSDCIGNCEFAQRVRNRDVVRPPFPERNAKTGELLVRECPPLYEVEKCVPNECTDDSPFAKDGTLSSRLRSLSAKLASKENRTSAEAAVKRTKAAGTGIHAATNRGECTFPNPNCCKVIRPTCPDGQKPRQLIRWYRKKDEQFCRPYRFPFCYDLFEGAFSTEDECLGACFTETEKAVLTGFRVI